MDTNHKIDKGEAPSDARERGAIGVDVLLLVGAGAFLVLLAYFAVKTRAPEIESTVEERARMAAAKAGYGDIEIRADGRDLFLAGIVGSEEDRVRVREIADSVPGSRVIRDNLEVATTPDRTAAGQKMPGPESGSEALAKHVEADIASVLQAKTIQFRSNDATLTPLGMEVLDEIALLVTRAPTLRVEIRGYSDSTGNPDWNKALSRARAEMAKHYLVKRGNLSPRRLRAVGYGETRPVASNQTPDGRRANRRIEFHVMSRSRTERAP